MANEWQNAVTATLDLIRTVPGVSTATGPQDAQNAPLFAVGYVGDCDDYGGAMAGGAGGRKSLGEIHIELCTDETDAPAVVAALMPLADAIPNKLLHLDNFKLGGTVETFAGIRRTGIQTMPLSGYVGIRFTLYGVKIISDIA
jgi:hypothetical protein